MARTGEKGVTLPAGNLGWDEITQDWEKIYVVGGAGYVNIAAWGGETLTGRDITPDIQSLADDTVVGMLRSIGDAGAAPTNATGNTLLEWLNILARSIDDATAAPTAAATTKTVRRLLEDILGAVGGSVNEDYERLDFSAPLNGSVSTPQSFSQAVDHIDVLVEGGDLDVEVSDSVGGWPGHYHLIKEEGVKVIPLNTLSIRVLNRGGATYTTAATAVIIGYF